MANSILLSINGDQVSVPPGTTVAAVISSVTRQYRVSISGEPRGPVCGMGICFECRVTINGVTHLRSCMIACEAGMVVRTDG